MLFNIVSILAGFILLVKGAEYLVEGASALARRLGVPALVIGLTVVAFGTSAPEFFVNVDAAINGSTDIAVGNILGSNFANILIILGIAACFAPMRLQISTIWKEIPFSLLAAVLVFILGCDKFFDGSISNELSRTDGIALLGFFIIFLVYSYSLSKNQTQQPEQSADASLSKTVFSIICGLIALVIGGRFVVTGAVSIATLLGVSQNLIALTIVAVGTSLPELVSSIVAARKGHVDIAIGNVVGSNIFNIFFVLAVSAIITPLPFAGQNITDALAVMFATLLLFGAIFIGKRHILFRFEGVIFLIAYFAYICFAVVRG